MDNSLTLARHFARLVWLLIHEGQATDQQKVALRAVVFVSKEASVRLGSIEGRLAVNGLVMPQALSGVRELADRLQQHAIEEITIEQGAAPAELLGLARLLAVGVASTSDAADFTQRLSELDGRTVRVQRADRSAAARTGADAPEAAAPVAADRPSHLYERLTAATSAFEAHSVLDEVAFMAEQAAREGRTTDTADQFTMLLDFEAKVTDPEIRRVYVVTMRRLTKPTLLRPIAALLSVDPARMSQVERILQRCGQDGVDSVVDRYAGAGSAADRRLFRETLFRLPFAREALVHMLADSRWHVVRLAAEFLGDMSGAEVERPLSELLRHQDERVRRAATRALGRADSTFALDAVARSLSDDAPTVRLEAVSAMATRKLARAGPMLAKAIDEEAEPEVQFAMLAALGRVGTAETVQKLAAAAAAASGFFKSKKNNALRVAAVLALGDARTPGALTALQGLANDREKDVRDAVQRAISFGQRGTAA